MKGLKLKFNYWGKRILFFGFLIFLVLLVFLLKIPSIDLGVFTIYNPLYSYTINVEWWLYLLIYFNVVFFINSIIFIIATIIIRNNKIKSQKREKRDEQIIADKIMELIYKGIDNNAITNKAQIAELINNTNKDDAKIILLNILRKIHTQAKDEVSQKAVEIFDTLNLNNFIKTNLHSPYFRDKIFAMKIISEFQLGMKNVHDFENNEFHDYIIRLTKKRNYVLRTEAFVSLIKLAMQDDLSFLLDNELHVSIWDMNVVLKIFKDIKNNNINYASLIQSDSPRVAALGVLLANKHQKKEFKDLIYKKIGSEDGLLNFEAYAAYISMADNDSDYHFFMDKFTKEKPIIKRAIVKAFNNCTSKEIALAFLNKVIEQESLILKVEAMKILMQLDANKVNDYINSENIDILKARKQIVDFNLN